MYNSEEFENTLKGIDTLGPQKIVAAGVSGGPDSMAMLWLLSQWGEKYGHEIHAFTVDHGLRPESADEAKQVELWVKDWPSVTHKILNWEGEKPDSRILEEARFARYALLTQAAKEAGARSLFIAHQRDDQAETFLIRLAKGSGLDGLCCMKSLQETENDIEIIRPLLDVSKDDLVFLCQKKNIPYVDDPTNKNQNYLRPRLRAAREALEEEGLSAKRLAVTAQRLRRARNALETLSQNLFDSALLEKAQGGLLMDYRVLEKAPEELVLRVMLRAMQICQKDDSGYGPRMEKAEALLERILEDSSFKGATLGGCIFAKDAKNGTLWIGKEE